MLNKHKFELPTVFVAFGITGDLFRSKILPSLFKLYLKNKLPEKLQIYGVSRRNWNDKDLRKYVEKILKSKIKQKHGLGKNYSHFIQSFHFVSGYFENINIYRILAHNLGKADKGWSICSNKLFYISTSPVFYKTIIEKLKESGLTEPCGPKEGWTRVILEKPFGSDLNTAQDLDKLLSQYFHEEQIFRVDHYLAKETVRNILSFRFSNAFLSPMWNREYIERIEIRMLESKIVGNRGEFYDKVGALRDVGQNHILQLLSLFTMDNPGSFAVDRIRKERAKALKRLHCFSSEDVALYTARGQYKEYGSINGVSKDSKTETYFSLLTTFISGGFRGVPVHITSGKAVGKQVTDIRITFKHPSPCLCPASDHYKNILHYRINPSESISIRFIAKKPGYDYKLIKEDFILDYKHVRNRGEDISDYEQLLLDIIKGDQTLFVSTEEVMAQWRFVQPILKAWKSSDIPVHSYKKGELPRITLPSNIQTIKKGVIGIVGLGKMGGNMALRLLDQSWKVVGYNRTFTKAQNLEKYGLIPAQSIKNIVKKLKYPRIIILSLPAGKSIDEVLFNKDTGLFHLLSAGDIVIDAANSFYKDTINRHNKLMARNINFVDMGISGGPKGARTGACLMIGGDRRLFHKLEPLYSALAQQKGYAYFPGSGAGHFVKMVHNGIEYGMMQAIAEGFSVLKASKYKTNLASTADIYNHGSVIESRLIGWLFNAFINWGSELDNISGSVDHSGEGEWTVQTARDIGIKTPVIEEALKFRVQSNKKPSFTGKVLSAMRGQFGGHAVEVLKKEKD